MSEINQERNRADKNFIKSLKASSEDVRFDERLQKISIELKQKIIKIIQATEQGWGETTTNEVSFCWDIHHYDAKKTLIEDPSGYRESRIKNRNLYISAR